MNTINNNWCGDTRSGSYNENTPARLPIIQIKFFESVQHIFEQ